MSGVSSAHGLAVLLGRPAAQLLDVSEEVHHARRVLAFDMTIEMEPKTYALCGPAGWPCWLVHLWRRHTCARPRLAALADNCAMPMRCTLAHLLK